MAFKDAVVINIKFYCTRLMAHIVIEMNEIDEFSF